MNYKDIATDLFTYDIRIGRIDWLAGYLHRI